MKKVTNLLKLAFTKVFPIYCLFKVIDRLLAILWIPWKTTFPTNMNNQVRQWFEVIPSWLFNTLMDITRSIPKSAKELTYILHLIMLTRYPASIQWWYTKINQMYLRSLLTESNDSVLGLNILMNYLNWVQILQPFQKLRTNHQSSLYRESTTAKLHEVTYRRSKRLHANVSISFCLTLINDQRNTFHVLTIK